MCTAEELACLDEEDLQFEYEQECDRVQELKNELKGAKLEVQQLRMRLKAAKVDTSRCGGASGVAMPALPGVTHEDSRHTELANFIMWLAEQVELEHRETFHVGFEVPIAGTAVHLQDIIQWPLKTVPGRRLRMSVPVQWEDEILTLLEAAQRDGMVNLKALQTMAATWELLPGEITTMTQKASEPAVLLARKGSVQGILVATWPTQQCLEAFHALCTIDNWTPTLGDRVEVEYDGDWYLGTLHSLDATGKASVSCDVDAPGVLTLAPMHRLRQPGTFTSVGAEPAAAPPDVSSSTAVSTDIELPAWPRVERANSEQISSGDRASELPEHRRLLCSQGSDSEKPAVDTEPGNGRTRHRRTRSAM